MSSWGPLCPYQHSSKEGQLLSTTWPPLSESPTESKLILRIRIRNRTSAKRIKGSALGSIERLSTQQSKATATACSTVGPAKLSLSTSQRVRKGVSAAESEIRSRISATVCVPPGTPGPTQGIHEAALGPGPGTGRRSCSLVPKLVTGERTRVRVRERLPSNGTRTGRGEGPGAAAVVSLVETVGRTATLRPRRAVRVLERVAQRVTVRPGHTAIGPDKLSGALARALGALLSVGILEASRVDGARDGQAGQVDGVRQRTTLGETLGTPTGRLRP